VFLTLAVCLAAGGIFQFVDSIFELPEEITPSHGAEHEDGKGLAPAPSGEAGGTGLRDGLSGPGEEEGGTALTSLGAGETLSGRELSGNSSSYGTGSLVLSAKLDLNKATAAELDALPGIGPAIAARIIEQRKRAGGFRSVEDLLEVRGIGEKTLAKFRQWVYVGSSD